MLVEVYHTAQQVDEADGWEISVGMQRLSAAAYLSR
jgi:hypothetical protein